MQYDMVVIGGGLVGAGLALALKNSSLRIALVDAKPPSNQDQRLFALNIGSCHFLNHLNVWDDLAPLACAIDAVHVSRQGHFGSVRLHKKDMGLPSLGHVVPARFIEKSLNDALKKADHITLFQPATLEQFTKQDQTFFLKIQTETGLRTLHTSFLIGADGMHSTVRAQSNFSETTYDYGQSAIVTQTGLTRPHHHIAYERFLNDGAIAMLPLCNQHAAAIITASNERAAYYMSLSDDDFLCNLQNEFGYRLGRFKNITQRHMFPLRMIQADQSYDDGLLLLGNAARSLHPIAAQGFNLAIYEVAILVEAIQNKLKPQKTFSFSDLKAIKQIMQSQESTSVGLSHRLPQLFSDKNKLQSIMLQIGMVGLNMVTPLKKQFMKQVMGLSKTIPRLLMSAENL